MIHIVTGAVAAILAIVGGALILAGLRDWAAEDQQSGVDLDSDHHTDVDDTPVPPVRRHATHRRPRHWTPRHRAGRRHPHAIPSRIATTQEISNR